MVIPTEGKLAVEPEWRRELSDRLHAYRVRRHGGVGVDLQSACPLRLNPAPGSKEQILCPPMPHSHLECGRLFAGGRGQNALKFPSPDMKWHTRLRKSIVRLGHNPPSERRQTPFSQLRR